MGEYARWPWSASSASFMINFRVRDLHAMLAQLRAAGAAVDEKVPEESYGKFGWVMDPEGNRIELWQPPTDRSA
jgi:predicted enzyme related to lactoylglutathione lyase